MRKQKVKSTILIAFFALFTNFANGQSSKIEITYNELAELTINETSINRETTVVQLSKILGKASKTIDYPSGEISHFYEEDGLVLFTIDGIVKGVGINFNWDGDEKFPEITFGGTLNLGELKVDKDTKNEGIAAIESIEFLCPVPLICASKNRDAKINCSAVFKDKNLTQVVFLIR